MRRLASVAVFLLACPTAFAQHRHAVAEPGRISPCEKQFAQAEPMAAWRLVNWPVTTDDGDAQLYFNQGMTQYYAFNYEEAMRNFRRATELDKDMPMAWWGLALGAGPNINLGMDDACRKMAMDNSAHAVRLAEKMKDDLTNVEYALINALPLRYAGRLTETAAYAVAMRYVWREASAAGRNKGPVVANVGALYAESLVELRPWGLFDAAYKEALDTPAILEVLDTAAKAETDALGANHYLIHALEASPTPGAAMESAEILTRLTPTPEAPGHLAHMPSHIYLLTGEYERARKSNTEAVDADRTQYGEACKGSYAMYTANDHCPALYYGHYLSHNLFFRSLSAAFSGQSAEAVTAACETREHAWNFVANEPGLQRYLTAPLMALVMNRNWTAVREQPKPPEDCYKQQENFASNGCHIYTAMWHWAQGMAAASADAANRNLADVRDHYNEMAKAMSEITPPTPTGWGNNSAAAMLAIAQSTLQARYTWATGQCKPGKCQLTAEGACRDCEAISCVNSDLSCTNALEQAIEHLKLAVTHEDALVYDEPPQWFPPAREALGGAYLRVAQSNYPHPLEMYKLAERTFNAELDRHPKSGRALFGRMRALEGLGEKEAAAAAKDLFCDAWFYADYTMTDDELWPAGPGKSTATEVSCQKPGPPKQTQCRCNAPPCPPPTKP